MTSQCSIGRDLFSGGTCPSTFKCFLFILFGWLRSHSVIANGMSRTKSFSPERFFSKFG